MSAEQTVPIAYDHKTAVAFRWLRAGLWRQSLMRLGVLAGDRPIASYGGGQHTMRLMRFMSEVKGAPRVLAIIDDNPSRERISGIPLMRPAEIDPGEVALVLVSSDWIEDKLVERAQVWSGGRVPVERLYAGMPQTALHTFENSGELVEWLPDGSRRVTDEFGNTRTELPRSRDERAPSAIAPVNERRIWTMRTPGYEVGVIQVVRELDGMFKTHQVYPGDRHRPNVDLRNEDFATHAEPGLVTKSTRVSVIGSCFAANFRSWLIENEYNFCQFEDGPFAAFGSLRTGPLFNTGSVRQLAEWSYHGMDAAEPTWNVGGRLCDPYRKYISWPSERDMYAEREAHFAAVRAMVAETDVLILTLGLSEVWRNKHDKRCFYLIPPPGVLDLEKHEHALQTVDECLSDIERFYAIVREHNPALRLVTTLSPVPLMATYFDRHAVVSDAVSKATLRTALHWFCQNHPEVIYFPSYEMAVRTPDWPYEPDNRHVRRGPVVDRIMRSFMQHYGEPGDLPSQVSEAKPGAAHATA
ncbi:MAG: GSCFA domain-containing protein [Phycisphaerales bacterium]|nr:GSCFA domain-containing protein [Phycisphaerales bacterium]MCB9836953.1 GSCFA domain-containing protein [Phycisphaera sp.]